MTSWMHCFATIICAIGHDEDGLKDDRYRLLTKCSTHVAPTPNGLMMLQGMPQRTSVVEWSLAVPAEAMSVSMRVVNEVGLRVIEIVYVFGCREESLRLNGG